jgi:hypothetical protein
MERLKIPMPDGGAPYKNQDFYQFLQENHIDSYSAFLDEINDRTTGNCGIILKGIKEQHTVLATPPQGTIYNVFLDSNITYSGLQDSFGGGGYLVIAESEGVNFQLSSEFNIVQVSKATWDANGDTPLSGGFQIPYGGGVVYPVQYVEAAGGTFVTNSDGSLSIADTGQGPVFTLHYVTQTEEVGQTWGIRRKGKITVGRSSVFFVTSVVKSYDLRDSLVYIDGEFLEPAPWLASQSQYGYNDGNNGELFYIHKCSDQTLEAQGVEFKTQRFTKVNDFPEDVIKISYFDISPTDPGINHIEVIAFSYKIYVGSGLLVPSLPNILTLINQDFGKIYEGIIGSGTTRYFSRILKYYLSDEDDMYMTFDLRFFTPSGYGFGPMFGFKVLSETRFLLGYATGSNTRPWNLSDPSIDDTPNTLDNNNSPLTWTQKSTYTNYSRVGNTGGEEFTFLVDDHLPIHNHGGMSGTPSNDMSHSHGVATADAINPSNDPPTTLPGFVPDQGQPLTPNQLNNSTGYPSPPGIPWDKVRLAKGTGIKGTLIPNTNYYDPNGPIDVLNHKVINPSFDGKTYEISYTDAGINRTETEKDLGDHTHPIYPGFWNALESPNGNLIADKVSPVDLRNSRDYIHQMNTRHYNVPPYITVTYYVKYDPYQ